VIVDDSADFVRAARALLKRQGMSVVGDASNTADAIAVAAALEPDLALVDVDLGVENGFDAALALASADTPVPVIMISAYDEAELEQLLVDSPALGFVPKTSFSREAIDRLLVADQAT
jgi:DNA-binding NarL/FixJ family response regulator